MSHPDAGPELISRVFGDVHMLSHLQGASNRASLKRMKSLDIEIVKFREMLAKTRQHHKEQMTRRDALIQQQEQELLVLMSRSSYLERKINAESSIDGEQQNESLTRRLDWAEKQLAGRDIRNAELYEEMLGLKELLKETQNEHLALEQTMMLLLAEEHEGNSDPARDIDLNGKRVLYVGGRSTLVPHLRAFVEAHNGRFDHHDGGLENSRAGLQWNLMGADMVFCPVSCISHDACLRVKRHCQKQAKRFVPLRSSGLSAFAGGLRRFCEAGADVQSDSIAADTI